MATPDEVRRSLLTGDHGRDGVARRRVADQDYCLVHGQVPVVDTAGHVVGVSPDRQGWRARLANVERLLLEVDLGFTPGVSAPTWNRATAALIEAVAEVRSIIDGEGE